MYSDLRSAFRQLAKAPGFTLVAVLTLAVGIGANTAIFSVIHGALLRPLGYPDSGRLVEFWSGMQASGNRLQAISGPEFKQIREQAASFESVSGFHKVAFNYVEHGRAQLARGLEVSANYLDTLGVGVLHGENFPAHADQLGGPNRVVILTYEWWQSQFGGTPDAVGRIIRFGNQDYTVVGILRQNTLMREDPRFLVPLVIEDSPWRLAPDNPWLPVIARLKPGVSLDDAQTEVGLIGTEVHRRLLPDRPAGRKILARPLKDVLVADTRPTLWMLLGAVTLVLLITCANVANLLLVRAAGRQREMAVRSALGASRRQLVRQVLTESIVLALIGGMAGIVVAVIGVKLLGNAVAGVLPQALQPGLDPGVLLFSILLTFTTGCIFGLFPALRSARAGIVDDLKDTGRGSTSGSRSRAQSLLVICEVALTAALLIGAGLLLRSFDRVMHANLGFNPNHALVGDLSLTEAKFSSPNETVQYLEEVVRRVETVPGVVHVGTATTLPLSDEAWGGRIGLVEVPLSEHTGSGADYVSGRYFEAMGIGLLKGRFLTDSDNRESAPRVAVINDVLATALLPGQEAVGRHVRFRDDNYEIVGVVSSIRQRRIEDPAGRRIYLAHVRDTGAARLVVRTAVSPLTIVDPLKRVFADVDPEQSISNIRTLEQAMSQSVRERRVALVLVVIFASIALGLACLGIYGVMAYTIGQRERELSIRLALGAQSRQLLLLVLQDGLRLSLVGIAFGLIVGAGASRFASSRLYEVSALDAGVYSIVLATVALVAFVAVLFPALRTTRVDALRALRTE